MCAQQVRVSFCYFYVIKKIQNLLAAADEGTHIVNTLEINKGRKRIGCSVQSRLKHSPSYM